MNKPENSQPLSKNEFWEVSHAAGILTSYACSVSARHIQDGMLRLQFNREVAYYMREIVRDVESGRKSAEQGIQAIKEEQRDLLDQSTALGRQLFGAYAGGMQVYAGVGMMKAGYLGAIIGGAMTAHGINNIYESVQNIKTGRTDAAGPVRKFYQSAAEVFGKQKAAGNEAYGYIDIALTGYSWFSLVRKKDAWRLFRYIRSDYQLGIERASLGAIITDISATALTLDAIQEEQAKRNIKDE
jgi:hypothetical protein